MNVQPLPLPDAEPLSEPMIDAYLDRIGYSGSREANAETLFALQKCHVHTVPYETLDVVGRIPISLSIQDLYDKIVRRRRGGYCFEQNALFGALLQALGFRVTSYFGRFWRDERALPPKRRHHILQVAVEGQRYMCDVGAGAGSPIYPLFIQEGTVQEQDAEAYRFTRDEVYGWMLWERKRGEWDWVYSFAEEPHLPMDFAAASFWCEHAPDSPFRQENKASIRTPHGRNTLLGGEFRIFELDSVRIETPADEEKYAEALERCFGITLARRDPSGG